MDDVASRIGKRETKIFIVINRYKSKNFYFYFFFLIKITPLEYLQIRSIIDNWILFDIIRYKVWKNKFLDAKISKFETLKSTNM